MREPRSPAAHREVGKLCLERGMYGRAVVELRRTLELDPRSPGTAALLEQARQRAEAPGPS